MNENSTILVIEDDKYISHFIDLSLTKEGYRVIVAESGSEGMFMFSSYHPSIVLLDLGLPDRDGVDILRELRTFSDVPILVVSARGQESEKIEALDLGANDYVTKPFYMGELMARIRVAERAAARVNSQNAESIFKRDWLTVDYEKRKVLVDDQEIHLTPTEYKTLLLLIANKGKVLTHNYIIQKIWGTGYGDSKSVRVFMASLRRKIEKDTTHPRFILTEVGVGYRFSDL
ncbi:MAG: response regulator transcription factor [Inconstantimicrobium porci]|uniref:Stage 0 sporulation protein A homolog n=1 Tax=Inconstantimicrobium porci TaxID=2652291 RepID=A0A7X2T228_9CLOT|nr:response regulator transcription factor [Inconstantimicrobium porci]MDY5910520.1 response regulator transcription factor [Inconstantimicrobium porci]MSR91503.1 response regulator transcription factor [Inconstantimicrobium porci]